MMVTSEQNTANATVRIHDDCFTASPKQQLDLAGKIVSDAYHRRVKEAESSYATS